MMLRWQPVAGAELSLRADTRMPFYAEYQAEAAVGYRLAPAVQLVGGYRWWHTEIGDLQRGDYDVALGGVVFGLILSL
jgi:hypothetical protein